MTNAKKSQTYRGSSWAVIVAESYVVPASNQADAAATIARFAAAGVSAVAVRVEV